MNIMLDIAFDGSAFHGWQVQNDVPTVCGTIEKALSRLYSNEKVKLIGSSRTDAGVNALSYIANFHAPFDRFDMTELIKALNATTPEQILIRNAIPVDDDFQARFSAFGKVYQYRVVCYDMVFGRQFCYRFHHDLDIEALNDYARLFIGTHNFSAFSVLKSVPPNPLCAIDSSFWRLAPDGIYIYEIQGNRFLHEMVRMIVGAQLDIARGVLKIDDIVRFLQTGERQSKEGSILDNSSQIKVVPGNALFLVRVIY